MSDPAHVPAILQEPRRVRYLKIIALFKIFKGVLRATGILALFYCGVLFTEGIGVYMQKRWAEFLMIFATGALIPLEMRHVWHRLIFHRPIFAPILLLLANCFLDRKSNHVGIRAIYLLDDFAAETLGSVRPRLVERIHPRQIVVDLAATEPAKLDTRNFVETCRFRLGQVADENRRTDFVRSPA